MYVCRHLGSLITPPDSYERLQQLGNFVPYEFDVRNRYLTAYYATYMRFCNQLHCVSVCLFVVPCSCLAMVGESRAKIS